jgi:hypothetical protein
MSFEGVRSRLGDLRIGEDERNEGKRDDPPPEQIVLCHDHSRVRAGTTISRHRKHSMWFLPKNKVSEARLSIKYQRQYVEVMVEDVPQT